MDFNFTNFVTSVATAQITVIILGTIISLYLIYHTSKRLDVRYSKYFDKFFKIVFFGLFLSRIIFLIFNFATISNLTWSFLPQTKTENLYTYEIQREWSFEVMPWKVLDINSGINPSGFLIVFIIYFLNARRNYKKGDIGSGYKYFAHIRILFLPVVTFMIFILLSLFIQFGATEFISKFYDLDLILIVILTIALVIIFLKGRSEKIEFDAQVRNSTRETADVDILKETAEKVRTEKLAKLGIRAKDKLDETLKTNFENVVGKILKRERVGSKIRNK